MGKLSEVGYLIIFVIFLILLAVAFSYRVGDTKCMQGYVFVYTGNNRWDQVIGPNGGGVTCTQNQRY